MLENGSKEGSRVKHQMVFTTMLKTFLVGVSRERKGPKDTKVYANKARSFCVQFQGSANIRKNKQCSVLCKMHESKQCSVLYENAPLNSQKHLVLSREVACRLLLASIVCKIAYHTI